MALSTNEARTLALVDPARVTSLLQLLVQAESVTSDLEAAEVLCSFWQQHGVPHDITSVEAGQINVTAHTGPTGRSLLFNSHLDTVPAGAPERWELPPFQGTLSAEAVFGRGAVDAKGSIAAMAEALLVLHQVDLDGRVLFSAVAREETGGLGTQHDIARGIIADAAIVGEPTGLDLKLGHRGSVRITMTARGQSAHSAHPDEGRNAVLAAALLTQRLAAIDQEIKRRRDPVLCQPPRLTITMLHGGDAPNVVPGTAQLTLDRRTLPEENPQSIIEEVKRQGAFVAAETGVAWQTEVLSVKPAATTAPQSPFVSTALGALRDLGYTQNLDEAGFFAGCDMAYLSQAGIPAVILGPGAASQCHVIDERLPIDQLVAAVRSYILCALRWCSGTSRVS